jgi:site-specific DNA recombinase
MTSHQGTRRAALYQRVSRSGGRDAAQLERTTLAEQEAYARAVVPQSTEIVVDARWRDIDVSGAHSNRPGLHALFDDVQSGRVDDVVVGYLSRLGRNMIETFQNVETLTKLGATVYFGKERLTIIPDDPSGTSTVILAVFAAVAQMERDRLRDSLKRSNESAVARGVSIAVPYGYLRENGPGSVLVPDHETAPIVERIFRRRLEGAGCSTIAHELNADDVPTPTALAHARKTRERPGSARWVHNTISAIVGTRTYKGVIPRVIAHDAKGRSAAWEELPGEHVALVTPDDWAAAQLTGRAVRNGTSTGALLQGLVRCSSCSRTMRPANVSRTTGQGRRAHLTYACNNRACPRKARITRAPVDEHVVAQLLVGATQASERVEHERAQRDVAAALVEQRERELDGFVDFAGTLPPEKRARGYAQHSQRLEDAQRALAAHESSALVDVEQLHGFDELTLDDRRAMLQSVLDAVVVEPALGQGRAGDVADRVTLIGKGAAPFELSGSGRVVPDRPWPL